MLKLFLGFWHFKSITICPLNLNLTEAQSHFCIGESWYIDVEWITLFWNLGPRVSHVHHYLFTSAASFGSVHLSIVRQWRDFCVSQWVLQASKGKTWCGRCIWSVLHWNKGMICSCLVAEIDGVRLSSRLNELAWQVCRYGKWCKL